MGRLESCSKKLAKSIILSKRSKKTLFDFVAAQTG
jgi:hypothetical protein